MIGPAIGSTLSSIIINVLSSDIYEKKQKVIDIVKLNAFKKDIEEWLEAYCIKNDGSILTTSVFQNYVTYQMPILKIFKYVSKPDAENLLEYEFISGLVNECCESVVSSGAKFSVNDELIVRELFTEILNKYKQFLFSTMSMSEKYALHITKQTIKGEAKGFIEEVKSSNNMTKKIYDLLNERDEICEDKKVEIYVSLCNILWQGDVEGVCGILPLVESKDRELEVALKMNLGMIADYKNKEQYSVDVLQDIKCRAIKEDIVRRIVVLCIENDEILKEILKMIDDSQLKQIVEDVIKRDFSNIFSETTEKEHGAEVKQISKSDFYDNEQWLVKRIIFMHLYGQSHYGTYLVMKEFVQADMNVLEKLLIWEKQELELFSEYEKDENNSALQNFCTDLKGVSSRYSRLKEEYQKIYNFMLIKSAVITDDVEVDDIIEKFPDFIKADKDIQEWIFLLQIKRGVAAQEDIVKFCQETGKYMLLYDYLVQWRSVPEKIISFIDDYKYLLSEQLTIFLMYVQAIRIEEGAEVSRKTCEKYKDKYEDYLEYLLEMYKDNRDQAVLDAICEKKRKGTLLYLSYQSEEILIEVFMKNGMYDDAMEIIKKYEAIQKITPNKLRMKAAILLAKGKVLESLSIFLNIFETYKEDTYVIANILNISLQYKRKVPEKVMVYAEKSSNVDILSSVAMVYARESDFESSRKFLTMALLRSDTNNQDVFGKYWGLHTEQGDNPIVEIKNVDKDTAVVLKCADNENTVVYCIYNDKVLPEEPYEWESAMHIYKDYAIKLGLFRKKVGDTVEISQSDYVISEIISIDNFLGRMCVSKMIDLGMAKGFHVDINEDKINNQDRLVEWLQENMETQKEFNWLDYYKDFSQMPTTLYSLYKCTKLSYEQFILAMLEEKNIIVRNMLNENGKGQCSGYVLSFSDMVMMYKLGVQPKILNENGVVIPSSVQQLAKEEAVMIVNANAREHVASIGVYEGKMFLNETTEEEKQHWMEEAVKIKEYAETLITLDNYSEVNILEFDNETLKELFGICGYDAMAISKEKKKEVISGEATMIMTSQIKKSNIYTIDILSFLINICESANDMISYMKQMLELRFLVLISEKAVNYISDCFLNSEEEKQQNIIEKWNDFLASIETVGKEYKSIFTQLATDVMRSKFLESEEYDSAIWVMLARYVFHYNGFFFEYGFNEEGDFEIRTYKRTENTSEE
ncbi:MAG: hypothetical protein UFG06_03015 [Lachnospiraceae bacterium]|nr:hypothetical protein [Lachnospiraceae bacterium]